MNGAAIATEIDDLARNQFAFAIGVGGDDQSGRLAQKVFDDLELRCGLGFDLNPPVLGNNGKLLDRPALELFVIGFRRRGFDKVANASRHDNAGAVEATIAALPCAQQAPDVLALRRFFAEK